MRLLHRKDPKAQRLGKLPLFEHATPLALEHLASAADEVEVAAGTVLVSQGHFHNECLLIEEGSAEVEVDGEVVAEIPAGQTLGELAAFSPGPATATVRAKTDMVALVIPHNRFSQILDDNPDLTRTVARELADRLRSMDQNHALHAASSTPLSPPAEQSAKSAQSTSGDSRLQTYAESLLLILGPLAEDKQTGEPAPPDGI